MVATKNSESLFSVKLADGSTLDYPATFTARYAVSEPVSIRMLPLAVGVEEQAFLLIGELFDAIPNLESIIDAIFSGGVKNITQTLAPSDALAMIKAAVTKSPSLLIKFGTVICELDEDGVREKLTLAELVEMISPVIFLEKYRFENSFGSILEALGIDLNKVDETVEVGTPEPESEEE